MPKIKLVQISVLLLIIGFTACSVPETSTLPKEDKASESIAFSSHTLDNINKQSIGKKLKEHDHLPIAERIALYHQLKKDSLYAFTFESEDELNMYGYSLLWNEKAAEALDIFELLVSEFPHSSNPYDSYGEAFLANGDTAKALAQYEKAVELNPENFNAIAQMQRLKGIYQEPARLADKFSQVYTVQQYREDLDALGETLTDTHPNALKFISEQDFWNLIESKKSQINLSTTFGEFYWHCREIIASINCSHTSAGGFFKEWDMLPWSKRFPLELLWVEGHLYVKMPAYNKNQVNIKDEILSINGISVSDLMADIYRHIPSQGHIETNKKYEFNSWAPVMIPFALGFPESFDVQFKDKKRTIRLNPVQDQYNNYTDPIKDFCPDKLCFEILDKKNAAILTIASFNYYWWGDLNEFTSFMDQSFKEMQEQGIENLVIDLRFNRGGSYHASTHLLKYLLKEPFRYYTNALHDENEGIHEPFEKRFDGNLYFIIDGNGNSTTGHFMAIVGAYKLGTIIGEELGSNQFCTAGQTICRLPHTELEYYVANATYESYSAGDSDDRGILPDQSVSMDIEDYLSGSDPVKSHTILNIK